MDTSHAARWGLPFTVFLAGVLLLAVACESGSDTLSDSTAEAELSLDEALTRAGANLAALSTATFEMSDETESGARFFGTTLKSLEGEVRSPDGARMLVDVQAPGMGFVEIEIVAVGEQAFMKFSRDGPWIPLPPEQVPFNFGAIGPVLSEVLPAMENTQLVGREPVGDFQTVRIDGDILSQQMSDLITSVDPDHPITLSWWFDETEYVLRQFRIDGRLFNDDGPETSRLLTMNINVPVDIQLPEAASIS